jgi:aminodeoxyfutalosine synthase
LLIRQPAHLKCSHFRRPRLEAIREKVEAGERLSYDDGLTLYRSSDLLALGYMANIVRERMHGDVTYFNVNRHINPTDVCVASCRLCAFGKQKRDPNSYTMSLEQVWETAGKGWSEAITEFHIVGGLHPELNLDWFCQMLRGLKERFPQIHLKAFTMVEIGYFARREKMSVREVLERLRDAGHGFAAGRRRGSLQRARAAHHLRSQTDRRRVAGNGAHGA